MSDITGEEIEKLLKKAWSDFFKYYESGVQRYCEIMNMSNAEAIEEHLVVWNEHDLMFQLGRFFYKQLREKIPQDIEPHFDKFLSRSTFKDSALSEKLKELKGRLGWVPKSDLIIAQETNLDHFLLCAEAKFFHYSVARYNREPHIVIKKDIDTLVAIKDLGIAERVVFMLFDDYYCHRDQEKYKEIMSILAEAEEHKLTILKHP